MITQELKELVVKEALALREHSTMEEKEALSIEELVPSRLHSCIYGLMTGHCYNERASLLLEKCAQPYSESLNCYKAPKIEKKFPYCLNYEGRSFSAIEFYICQPGAKIEDLINLIKS